MRIALPVLVCAALAAAPSARADSGDAALQQEVQALKQIVHDLQQRVSVLEGRTPAAPVAANAGYVSPEAALRANWARIKADMEQGEVTRLLGAPSKKFLLDGRNVWYYYYPATGGGSVFFTDAGRVSSRQSPFGMGW
ncbi:MAG: hypothetical protein ACREVC_04580 [Burkholderiales bacterium]